jgi:enamine deaminase RidA (YjgF/YER057c/UK114 family)
VTAQPEVEHDAERRVAELRLALPDSIPPVGNYVRAVRTGDLLFISGHLPDSAGAPLHSGKLGRDVTTEQGYQAARQAAVNLLGTVRQHVGDLNRVHRIVKLLGMVNSTEAFTEQPQVIDGASDLLREVFGGAAMHARSAVGMAQLPRNNCVEIEAVIEVREWPGATVPGGGDIAREPVRPWVTGESE